MRKHKNRFKITHTNHRIRKHGQKTLLSGFLCYSILLRNVCINKKYSTGIRSDAFGICLLKQTAYSTQSVVSPSRIEEFREFEADLSVWFAV